MENIKISCFLPRKESQFVRFTVRSLLNVLTELCGSITKSVDLCGPIFFLLEKDHFWKFFNFGIIVMQVCMFWPIQKFCEYFGLLNFEFLSVVSVWGCDVV